MFFVSINFFLIQRGKVSIYDTRTKTWKLRLFLDMRSQVFISPEKGDEKGLLSLAFHPDYANNRRIFLFYALERGQSEPLPEEYQVVYIVTKDNLLIEPISVLFDQRFYIPLGKHKDSIDNV